MNVKLMQELLVLDIYELKSAEELLNKEVFKYKKLRKIKKQIEHGKINNIYFNDLLLELSKVYSSYFIKENIEFLIKNYSNKEDLNIFLDILKNKNVNQFIMVKENCINQNYVLEDGKNLIITDGNTEFGTYIDKDKKLYTEGIKNANYAIFINKEAPYTNIAKIVNLNNTLTNIKMNSEEKNIDEQRMLKNTKNVNEILNILDMKNKTIKLESLIVKCLKRNNLSDERRNELGQHLTYLHLLIKNIKDIENDLVEDTKQNNMSLEMLNNEIKIRKVKIK